MSGTRDLDAAVNTALQQSSGTAYAHIVEMSFGGQIRQSPTLAAGVGDTLVAWTGRGDQTKLHVFTSVDDGLTWQAATNGQPIPYRNAAGTIAPLPAGLATTNRTVKARVLFRDGAPGTVVDSFTLTVTLEDGTVKGGTESGAQLAATGTLIGCSVPASVGGLVAQPDLSLRFLGNRAGAVNANATPHDADGNPQGLHLSHGSFGEQQQWPPEPPDTLGASAPEWATYRQGVADAKAAAAMAFEGRFYAEKTTGVCCAWSATYYSITEGGRYLDTDALVLDLVEDTAGETAHVRCIVKDLAALAADVEGTYTITSLADSVVLQRWYHVAVSYDGFWLTLYLDGVVVAHRPLQTMILSYRQKGRDVHPGLVLPTFGPFVMGRAPRADNNQTTTNSFGGRLAEWRFYTAPLTSGQIQRRMRRKLTAGEVTSMVAAEGLAAYYPMDQGFGTIVLDYTGHNNHLLWNQLQVGTFVPPQLGWLPDVADVWRGYPIGTREVAPGIVEIEEYTQGRETAALDIDVPGDIIRVTDAPFDVEVAGMPYKGVGGMGELRAVQESGDLLPTGVEMSLSGLAAQHVSLALNAQYLDRPCLVSQITWDDDGVLLEPFTLIDARIDTLDVALGKTATVRVTAESHLRNWRRPKLRRWNDEGHRAVWPDDHGFEFLSESVDRDTWWPARVVGV